MRYFYLKFHSMDIREEIKKLSDAEKILLVEDIWDDIADKTFELSETKKVELDRRLEEIKSGKATFSSWDEVKQKAKRLIDGL
jgi:putative addiction module component (TIGR02574 family)